MADTTEIAWTDSTFNPWMGCTKVGPGCDHCYAERDFDHRFGKVKWGPGNPRQRTSAANWRKPLQWEREHEKFFAEHGRRRRVFCASLADVFDNEVPAEWRDDLFHLIEETPHLEWLLLTKRIGNVRKMCPDRWAGYMPPNIWLGITVVNQAEADRDIPKLLDTPAVIKFLSMEPLLGPVDLLPAFLPCMNSEDARHDPSTGVWECCSGCDYTGYSDDIGIDWVIVGGESGPEARPMHLEWARELRDQCIEADIPFHFKQWGEWAPNWFCNDDGEYGGGPIWMDRMGKKAAGRHLDGKLHDEFPTVIHVTNGRQNNGGDAA